MLDIQLLRHDIDAVAAQLKKRHLELDIATFKKLEKRRKDSQVKVEELQALRNLKSKEIGRLKSNNESFEKVVDEVGAIKQTLEKATTQFEKTQIQLDAMIKEIPNIPHESVPPGNTEADNVEIKTWGNRNRFDFKPKDHVELSASLGLIDFEMASKISGSRFVVMHADIAHLHRALIQLMLDTHTREHGYQEINVPYLVNADSCFGTGQLPKFEEDIFHIKEHDFYLIPTAEVPVTNLARDEILNDSSLPKKYVCHSPCFRSEAGSYGQDTRGMIRQHQFEKVELVQFVRPETSYCALEALTEHAENILQKLDLPYRVVNLCGGDLGFSAAKTYDIEVWLPSQSRYREISSCSNFEAFQARRMKARWRNPKTNQPELLHTLNGSGLAVGRTLIAVMENYQNADGSISVPAALQAYMNQQSVITPLAT